MKVNGTQRITVTCRTSEQFCRITNILREMGVYCDANKALSIHVKVNTTQGHTKADGSPRFHVIWLETMVPVPNSNPPEYVYAQWMCEEL